MKRILATLLLFAIPLGSIGCKPAASALRSSKSSKEAGKAIGKGIGAGAKAYGRLNNDDEDK